MHPLLECPGDEGCRHDPDLSEEEVGQRNPSAQSGWLIPHLHHVATHCHFLVLSKMDLWINLSGFD